MAYKKFQAWLVENGIKQSETADFLGIDRATFNNKLHRRNGADFGLEEVRRMCKHYRLSASEFFLIP
ncbi:XRE family transcriptional regulator [Veillonella magna]|uniref:XRE family transcriptional regulator n=1 Tax=Veillonella magna TaxID=464322 RepID=UPI0026DB7423|nr:XRE family transcriptional regulator [Veillonella magna]